MFLLRLILPLVALSAVLTPHARGEESSQDHWAFQAVIQPEVPLTADESWCQTSLDAFIQQGHQSAGLSPSTSATRFTLLRRASLSLTGLPPRANDFTDFENDPSPMAFERQVDRLLASPSYGERWGRHWLDVARYADAKGYVDAGEPRYPFAYTYRDYVIQAFNVDLPYDRFVMEQLAADQLDDRHGPASLAALGFLTVGSRFNFFPHDIIDDRIDVVTRGFLGLSVACARCHDHKFDPVPTEDYYSLYSIFANSHEPTLAEAPPLAEPGPNEDAGFLKKLREANDSYTQLRNRLHVKIMHELRGWSGDYLRFIVQSSDKHRTQSQPVLFTKRGLLRAVSAYSSGGIIRWERFLNTRTADDPVFGPWVRLWAADRESVGAEVEGVLAQGAVNPLLIAAFNEREVSSMADVADIYGDLLEKIEDQWQALLKTTPTAQGFPDADREQLRQALYAEDAPGTMLVDASEDCYSLDESVEVRKAFANIERVFLEHDDGIAPRPMLLVDRERPLEHRVFVRGNPQQLGKPVGRQVPTLFRSLSGGAPVQGSGRLPLARAIAHSNNPLTPRVWVNRVWQWHFGQGLVRTTSDFGMRSELPSHPRLLDSLASAFVADGWSTKKLHRFLLSSSTWQQASIDRPASRHLDPDNRQWWRMNRRRLDFETMRDAMLQVAGQLQSRHGGPPIRKRPDDIENHARTIYAYLDREKLAEIYRTFDFPSPDITAPTRSQTTVPQQSLFLLNNPFVLYLAKALVQQHHSDTVSDPLAALYMAVYGRQPDADERALAERFLTIRGTQAEVWQELAQTLLLSNEFQFMD